MTNVLFLLLIFTRQSFVLSSIQNDHPNLSGSPFAVHDWSSVGRIKLNKKIILQDPKGICCTTNYSAMWDKDDELIVFSAENFFCPSTVKRFQLDALHPDRPWETFGEALRRTFNKSNGNKGERYYQGNFPGVASRFVHYDLQVILRRCMTPFMKFIMDSEQNNIREELLGSRNIFSNANLADDNDHSDLLWHHVNQNEKEDKGEEEEEEEEKFLPGNSLIFAGENFYGSVVHPAINLSQFHSAPHADSTVPGIASVYTITNDSKYDATATAFLKSSLNTGLVHSVAYERRRMLIELLLQRNAILNGKSADEGWLNKTNNLYSEIIAVAFNKQNRIAVYPSNRFHTAYIPDSSLLNENPHKGRLTLNSFWGFVGVRDANEVERFCNRINVHVLSSDMERGYGNTYSRTGAPRTFDEILNVCNACKSWKTSCNWCPYSATCEPIANFADYCPSITTPGLDFNPVGNETTCKNSAQLLGECLKHKSCKDCNNAGCAWCVSKGRCMRDIQRACPDKFEHVGKYGMQKCGPDFVSHDCSQHTTCNTCTDSGACSWCKSPIPRCVANHNLTGKLCGTEATKKDIVGKFGHGSCEKLIMDVPMKKEVPISTNAVHCFSVLSCAECLNIDGCSWCLGPGDMNGECMNFPTSKCPKPLQSIVTRMVIKNREGQAHNYKKKCPALKKSTVLSVSEL
jgi:hypothetical protein